MGSSQSVQKEPEPVKLSHYDEAIKIIEENESSNLIFSNLELDRLPAIPDNVFSIHLFEMTLNSIDNLPENLQYLEIKNSKIDLLDMDILPKSIRELYITNSSIERTNGSLKSYLKLTYLISEGNSSGSTDKIISEFPKNLIYLVCSNNQLTSLPPLPKSLTTLDCSNNQLTSLPDLPKSLRNIKCGNNQLTSLPPLPKSLKFLMCQNNQLTSLPPLPKSLYSLNIYNNKIENLPNNIKVENIITCKNDTEDYECVKKNFNEDNIETHYSKDRKLTVLTLKKGTLLFRTMQNLHNIRESFVGVQDKNEYILSSDHESYFFLHPFNNGYGDNTVIFVLTNDVKVILGVNPSEDFNKKNINRDYGKPCQSKKYKSKLRKRIYSNMYCLDDKFIEEYPDVLGWLAPDDSGGNNKHFESNYFPKYRDYVSFYENKEGVLARPELVIYPLKKRSLTDVITPIKEFNSEWIQNHIEDFNYMPIITIDYNVEFAQYKKVIDKLLSDKGFSGYKARRDEMDGLYYLLE